MKTMKEILEGLKEAGLELVGFRNCHHEGDKTLVKIFSLPMIFLQTVMELLCLSDKFLRAGKYHAPCIHMIQFGHNNSRSLTLPVKFLYPIYACP